MAEEDEGAPALVVAPVFPAADLAGPAVCPAEPETAAGAETAPLAEALPFLPIYNQAKGALIVE